MAVAGKGEGHQPTEADREHTRRFRRDILGLPDLTAKQEQERREFADSVLDFLQREGLTD